MAEFNKPALFGGNEFDAFAGGEDPAAVLRAAHDSARKLLTRARDADDPAVVDRLVTYTDEHGLDALAELWARSSPHSLPGALWRIYLVRVLIRQDPDGVALLFQRGTEVLPTIDPVVAGAPLPAGPARDHRAGRHASCAAPSRATSRSRSSGRPRSAG